MIEKEDDRWSQMYDAYMTAGTIWLFKGILWLRLVGDQSDLTTTANLVLWPGDSTLFSFGEILIHSTETRSSFINNAKNMIDFDFELVFDARIE